MAEILGIDYETYSACELTTAGAEAYAEHRTTGVWCMAFKFDAEPTQLWTFREPLKKLERVFDHIAERKPVGAHNIPFEIAITKRLHRDNPKQWPKLALEQCDCTMARARTMSLPGGLGDCAEALRLPVRKDKEGHAAMMKLAKPRRREPLEFWTPETAPETFARLYTYCPIDVDVWYELHKRLSPLTDEERALWIRAQAINERGILVDVPSAQAAMRVIQAQKAELSARVMQLTGGASTATTRDKLLAWLQSEDVEISGMKKGDVAAVLADPAKLDGKEAARLVLEMRREASKTSAQKLGKALKSVCTDDRVRGLYVFHGAHTGRFTGSGFQPTNLMRFPKGFKYKNALDVIDWLRFPNADAALRHEYGSATEAIAFAMRAFVKAPPGRELISCDYSNIEGRKGAWLAGEEWKLDAFRDYDTFALDAAGNKIPEDDDFKRLGPDLYKLAASKSLGIEIEQVDDNARQIGKVQELALLFQGGIGSYLSMGANYGIDPAKIAAAVKALMPADVWAATLKKLPKASSKFRYGLEPEVWTGLRCVIDSWRAAHPRIKAQWAMMNDAACEAVEYPGEVVPAGPHLRYRKVGDFLLCKLPSGRCLYYPYAELKPFPAVAWEEKKLELEAELERAIAEFKEKGAAFEDALIMAQAMLKEHLANVQFESSLTYWGVSSKAGASKKFRQHRAYGGILFQNAVQASARDVFTAAWPALEAAGYQIVMHTYDEDVCEVDVDSGSIEEMAHIMCALPNWAHGLPIAAAGWRGERYRK